MLDAYYRHVRTYQKDHKLMNVRSLSRILLEIAEVLVLLSVEIAAISMGTCHKGNHMVVTFVDVKPRRRSISVESNHSSCFA